MALPTSGGKLKGVKHDHFTYFFNFIFQHPYPTEDEKRAIAAQTNLTLLQVKYEKYEKDTEYIN